MELFAQTIEPEVFSAFLVVSVVNSLKGRKCYRNRKNCYNKMQRAHRFASRQRQRISFASSWWRHRCASQSLQNRLWLPTFYFQTFPWFVQFLSEKTAEEHKKQLIMKISEMIRLSQCSRAPDAFNRPLGRSGRHGNINYTVFKLPMTVVFLVLQDILVTNQANVSTNSILLYDLRSYERIVYI